MCQIIETYSTYEIALKHISFVITSKKNRLLVLITVEVVTVWRRVYACCILHYETNSTLQWRVSV